MAAIVQASRSALSNRRRRVRHKVHVPAYACFSGAYKGEMLDLHEILDISEVGVAVQCSQPMEISRPVELTLDLAEAGEQISASAQVIWSDPSGHVGFALPNLPDSVLHRLQQWLFLNAMVAAANAASSAAVQSTPPESPVLRQDYTDVLTAASAVQREAEALGSDLQAILSLVAGRSQSLLRASGAAIALSGKDAGTMICRASAGPCAPPLGAILQVGSGFSGECVRTGTLLRCDDTEADERVDRQSCRSLGLRSMLAAPVRMGDKVVGLLEVFSAQPRAFSENDSAVLQRFADTILAAINRAARVPPAPPPAPPPFIPRPGSILFAQMPEDKKPDDKRDDSQDTTADEPENEKDCSADEDKVGGIRLPRAYLFLLMCAVPAIALALGYILAPSIQPWIQEKLHARERNGEHTVLASSQPPVDSSKSSLARPSADFANLPELRELARRGDPGAENALGLLYAQGDEKQAVKQDEGEAARWFIKAAEHGSVPAQSKLGSLYWSGRGLPQDSNRAYFWTVLARASGDDASKVLAPFIAARLTHVQRSALEQEAESWLQREESATKPEPGR